MRLSSLLSVSALGALVLLTQSGCFDTTRACAQSSDCFVDEACVDKVCIAPSIEPNKDASPDVSDEAPDHMSDGSDDSPDLEPMCKDALIECDGACVDPKADRAHCGECSRECGDEEACKDGQCVDPEGFCRGDDDCPDVPGGESQCIARVCTIKCEDPNAITCGEGCSTCPNGDGVEAVTCLETRCIVSRCEDGARVCDDSMSCCKDDQPRCTMELEPVVLLGGIMGGTPLGGVVVTGQEVKVVVSERNDRSWLNLDINLDTPPGSSASLIAAPQMSPESYSFIADVGGSYAVRVTLYDRTGRPSCQEGRADVLARP